MPDLTISNDCIHIDPYKAGVDKKQISPSLVSGLLEGCNAKWVFNTFSGYKPTEVDNPLTRGTWFHYVIEQFFKLPAEERTKAKMKQIAKETKNIEQFAPLFRYREAKVWLNDCMNSYFEMGAKPQTVEIATIVDPKTKRKQVGLETFVKGRLGNAKRDTLGYIDQLSIAKDGGLQVLDWKTGAKAYGEWALARQQIVYSELLRKQGHQVSSALLVYPLAKKILKIDVNDEELSKRAIADVEEADQVLDDLIETGEAPYAPSYLCSWCPLVSICPEAMRGKGEKMRKARESQPTPEELGEYVS